MIAASNQLWRQTRMLRAVTTPYVNVTAQHQRWHMFSGPLTVNEFVRLRYYVSRGGRDQRDATPRWMSTELVMPSHPRDWWRGIKSFRHSFHDKAILTALSNFRSHMAEVPAGGALPDDLAPATRYFSRAFASKLPDGDQIIRTEVWYGTDAITPPYVASNVDAEPGAANPPYNRFVEQRANLPRSGAPSVGNGKGPLNGPSCTLKIDRRRQHRTLAG